MPIFSQFGDIVWQRLFNIARILQTTALKSPPRLQRLLLRLQKYDISITYVPGKHMDVADTLSRASLNEKFVDSELIDDMEVVVHKSSTDRREARTNEI